MGPRLKGVEDQVLATQDDLRLALQWGHASRAWKTRG